MKKRILIALVVVLALAANASVVWGMPHLTVGNDALPRLGPDGRSGCVTIDTNNPASGSGWLHTFTYWASTANPFRFVLVDGSWEVKWVSDEITPSMVPEVNTYYAPAMSVPVEADWNLGVYSPGTGTVPYDYTGAPVCQTKGGLGVPTVGEYLDCQNYGASYYNRTYSFGTSDTLQVAIDIKPGSDPNAINLGSKGVIPVAILSSLDFDATEVNAGNRIAWWGRGCHQRERQQVGP